MRIIVPGKQNVLRLLDTAVREGAAYRPSAYLLRCETDGGLLLCSTLTGELALIPERELSGGLCSPRHPAFRDLAKHRLIVPESMDEYAAALQLRAVLNRARGRGGIVTHYNILTTTRCNARCFYCYENGIRQSDMSGETADRLVRFIIGHCGNKQVKLSWFGGEPLLGMRAADRICAGLRENGIDFSSDMTSNGYLFDDELVKKAREAWALRQVQITLDGTQEVYDRVKAYAGIKGSAFKRVIRNIGLLLDSGIAVFIRLNADLHNIGDLLVLARELYGMFKGRERLHVYARTLNEGAGSDPIRHDDSDRTRLDERFRELQQALEECGWPRVTDQSLPCLALHSCMADDVRSLQVAPDGVIGKCEDLIYEKTVGTLENGVTDKEACAYWREQGPREECRDCSIFPSCRKLLKNCPLKSPECPKDERERRIRAYRDAMLREYEAYKKGAAAPDGGEGLDAREECM